MVLVILDCGSQYTQLIRRAYDELGVEAVVVDGDTATKELLSRLGRTAIAGMVISGGAGSTTTSDAVEVAPAWLDLGIPILGVCFGYQWLAQRFGGAVSVTGQGFAGELLQVTRANPLIAAAADGGTVWMSHHDSVTDIGPDLITIARTRESPIAAFQHKSLPVYGVQFHPEVSHSDIGTEIFRAFAEICGLPVNPQPWSAVEYVDESVAQVREIVGDDRVLLALSGGVDSSTLCTLLARALRSNQLVAVYVDSGLMEDAAERLATDLCSMLGVTYMRWDASAHFFAELEGVVDPSEKCLVIGRIFAEELAAVARHLGLSCRSRNRSLSLMAGVSVLRGSRLRG